MEPRELPDLPFGLSLREHILAYLNTTVTDVRATFVKELATAKRIGNADATARLETAIEAMDTFKTDMQDIVAFVDRELNFYDVPDDLPRTATLVKVFEPVEYQGQKWVRVVFESRGAILAEKFLDLETCEAVSDALMKAVQQGREEE